MIKDSTMDNQQETKDYISVVAFKQQQIIK